MASLDQSEQGGASSDDATRTIGGGDRHLDTTADAISGSAIGDELAGGTSGGTNAGDIGASLGGSAAGSTGGTVGASDMGGVTSGLTGGVDHSRLGSPNADVDIAGDLDFVQDVSGGPDDADAGG